MQNLNFASLDLLPILMAVLFVSIFKLGTKNFTVKVMVSQGLLLLAICVVFSFMVLVAGRVLLVNFDILDTITRLLDFWTTLFLTYLLAGVIAASQS